MNTEQFLSIAEALRTRAIDSGADLNASNYLVHATLMRALHDRTLDEVPLETFTGEVERGPIRPQ